MKNRRKKLVGLLMGTIMLLGGAINVCAATPQAVANWGVSTYPGTSSSSSNFTSGVSIGGYGNVYARKKTVKLGNTYYVNVYCNGSGRTIGSGTIQG